MSQDISKAITNLLENPDKAKDILGLLTSSGNSTEENQQSQQHQENIPTHKSPERCEKIDSLQKKIDILKNLKPLLSKSNSNQIDLLINALSIAKVICEFSS